MSLQVRFLSSLGRRHSSVVVEASCLFRSCVGSSPPTRRHNAAHFATEAKGEKKENKESDNVGKLPAEDVKRDATGTSDEYFDADGPYDVGYHLEDNRFKDGKPTLAYVKAMPDSFSSMRHEQIFQLSAEGLPAARREALIRNIMAVDSIEYDEALKIFDKIAKYNQQKINLHHIPHKLGVFTAVGAGLVSIPLVFHLPTVEMFNTLFVTADVPHPKDLETWLEVGSWSWAWMEPLIGQASFFLLTMAFARAQLMNMGLMPYANFMRERRAKRLVAKFPRYNPSVVAAYSRSVTSYSDSSFLKKSS